MPQSPPARTIAFTLAAVLVALPVLALVALLSYDWNHARPWLNEKVSEAIDRPFEIRGQLALRWAAPGPQ